MNIDSQENSSPSVEDTLSSMIAACRRAIKHLTVKQHNLQKDKDEATKFEWYKQIADSILSAPKDFPRGTTQTQLINIHTQTIEPITLNAKLDAFKNADLLYKKSRKGKRGVDVINKLLDATVRELKKLDSLHEEAHTVLANYKSGDLNQEAIKKLFAACESLGLAKQEKQSHNVPEKEKLPFRQYDVDGWEILVGRNARENDELSVHYAKPSDIWMHVAQHAGSHVVIRRPKNAEWPPQAILVKAAAMAVWFSNAKHTSFAEVHVTEARYVHKRRKSPAGQVLLDNYKTLRVAPKSPQELFRAP
jgi:predicted ribosome quality control (RQC) complex YloA/Tae2 family protein